MAKPKAPTTSRMGAPKFEATKATKHTTSGHGFGKPSGGVKTANGTRGKTK